MSDTISGTTTVGTVGIVGLGLIGGSLAKAYKSAGYRILAFDTDTSILNFSLMTRDADGVLDEDSIGECDLILIAVYPRAAIEFIEKSKTGKKIAKNTIVIDCCGIKTNVCEAGFAAAKKRGFIFVGGHPMAGIEQSGFKHSKADLFKGATMVLIPPEDKRNDIEFLEKVKDLLKPTKLGKITCNFTAEEHDRKIAFTSQMAHLVSNAFIKSPTAVAHEGISAGSYKDLTRVAWLNEVMWTELFMDNRENLADELDIFIKSLEEYKAALRSEDSEGLKQLLLDGKLLKEKIDRK